jgi:hypothetical protein
MIVTFSTTLIRVRELIPIMCANSDLDSLRHTYLTFRRFSFRSPILE